MTEIMTPQNIIIGAAAVLVVRLLIWKYWTLPRRIQLISAIADQRIDLSHDLKRRMVRS